MRTKDIQAAVVELIKPVCPAVYFHRTPVVYPRIRAELKQIKTASPVLQFMLYLDYFGRLDEAEKLVDIADRVYIALRDVQYRSGKVLMCFHSEAGDRDEIGDTAADIKHIAAAVPLQVIIMEG